MNSTTYIARTLVGSELQEHLYGLHMVARDGPDAANDHMASENSTRHARSRAGHAARVPVQCAVAIGAAGIHVRVVPEQRPHDLGMAVLGGSM